MIVLYGLMCAFAWAIGGEKYFGKWRRGVLVAIPFLLKGTFTGQPWAFFVGLPILAYVCYQGLFYDICIKMIWPNQGTTPPVEKAAGWTGLFINGVMAGAMSSFFYLCDGKFLRAGMVLGLCGIAFMVACWLSNEVKFKIKSYCVVVYGVKIWCPEDSWWLACWLFGLTLGVL